MNRVRTQLLSNSLFLNSPTVDVVDRSSLVGQFCHNQLLQLSEQVSLLFIQLVFFNPLSGSHQIISQEMPGWATFDPLLESCVEPKSWWVEEVPLFQVTKLSIIHDGHWYICPLQRCEPVDYLLFGSTALLSEQQTSVVETHAKLISSYLCLFHDWYCQQVNTRLLEQTIVQTEHQLRGPLALLEIYSDILVAGLPEGDFRSQANQMKDALQELRNHIKDLADWNHPSRQRRQECDLRIILAECIKGLHPWLEEKCLKLQISQTSVVLQVDAWQMKQVFKNLLSNAIHFSPEGSQISCQWQLYRNEVLVEVCDEGPGLSETDLKFALRPFYSRRPEGTGLGLSIAQKIIADHGGRLWAENRCVCGTKFSFTLPWPDNA